MSNTTTLVTSTLSASSSSSSSSASSGPLYPSLSSSSTSTLSASSASSSGSLYPSLSSSSLYSYTASSVTVSTIDYSSSNPDALDLALAANHNKITSKAKAIVKSQKNNMTLGLGRIPEKVYTSLMFLNKWTLGWFTDKTGNALRDARAISVATNALKNDPSFKVTTTETVQNEIKE